MKAVRIHAYGNSDQLALEDVPTPAIGPEQVLVKIRDASVNPIDVKIRSGLFRSRMPVRFPWTVGQDVAGEVVELGPGVRRFAKGDRVFGFSPGGAYAEFASVPINHLAKLPATIDFETAATLPTAGLTAFQIIMDVAESAPGQRILIHGAGGGVGSFAVQLAVWRKAEVYATARASDARYLMELGVKQVIDFGKEPFEKDLRELDVVVDLIGGETQDRSFSVLRNGGMLITTVGLNDPKEPRQHGVDAVEFVMQFDAAELEALASLVDQGIIEPRLGRVIPLDHARQAQEMTEAGGVRGKIVLKIA